MLRGAQTVQGFYIMATLAPETLPATSHGIETVDVLIIGAGLSGIGAGVHLQANCPGKSFAILEGRPQLGGTWDLFRYPGIRSDSDMYTLGYAFKPWTNAKAIADGPAILDYLDETVREHDLGRHIRFGHKITAASWSTADALWTVDIARTAADGLVESVQMRCNFLHMCTGYYRYSAGYTPEWEGIERFKGRIVHPQHWPADLDYAGKKVVVIGSGATAVTLVPAMAETAGHVTMLQRSPSYVVSRPGNDGIATWLQARVPAKLAYGLTRWKNVLLGMFFFRLARKNPVQVKARLVSMVQSELGPDYDVATHFTPRYNPWDQRLCAVPDADLFVSLRAGTSSVVTDTIRTFTETGIELASGKTIDADIIVTATGLVLELLGGASVTVDGVAVDFAKTFNYKGMMYSGVPNLATSFGYTNASWTLKADLTCSYIGRLLTHMDKRGMRQCTPVANDADLKPLPFLDFSSGYVTRAMDAFPKQGDKAPWKVHQNYALDIMAFRFGAIEDGAMIFSNPGPR
jgi:monooxygenase